jgi:diaminopimelate decarboxylase
VDSLLSSIAQQHGTPCYVYDIDFLKTRATELRAAFGERFQLSYAVKANPNAYLLERMKDIVERLDISSGGELVRSLKAGWDPELISFTGPGKVNWELQASVDASIGQVIVESLQEADRLNAMAIAAGKVQGILVRIAPADMPAGFGVNMAGKPCQFGVDEEDADAVLAEVKNMKGLRIEGLHIYSGTQCLKAGAIAENYLNFIRIFRELCEKHDITPKKLVFGSGLGVPYYQEDTPLDLSVIANAVLPALDEFKQQPRFANTILALEVGRYLVGEAGRYLTSVVHVKQSRGTQVAVCDGGMNHNNSACGHMGSVIPRNYRMFVPSATDATPQEHYEIYGPLCTSIDRLARKVQLPQLQRGSVLALECSGAYGLTASPMHFISHRPAKEVAVEKGEIRDVSDHFVI